MTMVGYAHSERVFLAKSQKETHFVGRDAT